MIPRNQVVMLPRHASGEALRSIVLAHPHNRMPVYDERWWEKSGASTSGL